MGGRACGDIRRSLANSACDVRALVELISLGRVAEVVDEFPAASALWHFFKRDRQPEYASHLVGLANKICGVIAQISRRREILRCWGENDLVWIGR